MKNALIIFTKNLVHGKVKTRLSSTVGNDKAFEIYKQLVEHTSTVTQELNCDKVVFYTEEIEVNDVWKNDYQKQLQIGNNLGEKMMMAFNYVFKNKYSKAVVIGCDCPELSKQIINDAFEQLNNYDVVIGPAADGGYYLLGIKKMNEHLFENIEWSTSTVLAETVKRCKEIELSYYSLITLHDVDEEKDLQYMKIML